MCELFPIISDEKAGKYYAVISCDDVIQRTTWIHEGYLLMPKSSIVFTPSSASMSANEVMRPLNKPKEIFDYIHNL